MTTPGRIIAMGGGGFTMEPDNPLLDELVLTLAPANPRICFLPTASGDSRAYLDLFYETFSRYPCTLGHLGLFALPEGGIEATMEAADVFYVGGGNTVSMLGLWRTWGIDRLLHRAWRAGKLLAGVSAGSICWFSSGLTDSLHPGHFARLECLGLLPESHCPHYDSQPERQEAYPHLVQSGELPAGIAAEDGVALCYLGEELQEVVSSRPEARAYRVSRGAQQPTVETLVPRYLGR